MKASNTEDDLEKRTHIVIILTKMCEMVGIKYEDIDFTDDNWFMRHSWSSTTQDIFKAWLVDYLYNSYAARREICMVNYKSFKHLSKVASYFIMMYGWKSHAL